MEEKRKPRSFKSGDGKREKEGTKARKNEGTKARKETSFSKSALSSRPIRSYSSDSDRPKRSYSSDNDRPKRSFRQDSDSDRPKRSFRQDSDSDRPKRSYSSNNDRPKRTYNSDNDRPKRTYNSDNDRPKRSFRQDSDSDRPKRSYSSNNDRPKRTYNSDNDRPKRSFRSDNDRPKRTYSSDNDRPKRSFRSDNDRPKRTYSSDNDRPERRPRPTADSGTRTRKRRDPAEESEILSEIFELRRREGRSSPKKQQILSLEHEEKHGPVRLNKYISNSGICSRRDADMLIQTGAIQVNGQIVTELGIKVMPTDEVRYGDQILQREKPVYLLLNKPKDYITTMEDERDRKHVLQLVKGACKERIYPVGRLDKNTTGLLLFTNDGEMTKKLTHPKHGIRKIYYVELDKNLTAADFEKITNGIELSDGEIIVDEIAYTGETKREIGITLHSGRNRIVRRIFEYLGYEIEKLDRVVFAGLTKKDLPRGTYRFLTEAEINILKMTVK